MEPIVIASVITGGCTIFASIITLFVFQNRSRIFCKTIKGGRGKSVTERKWKGKIYPESELDAIYDTELKFTYSNVRKFIRGKLIFQAKHKDEYYEVHLNLTGGFYTESLLKLDYKASNEARIQFGSIVLNLNANADEMTGRYIGYGGWSDDIAAGAVYVKKTIV